MNIRKKINQGKKNLPIWNLKAKIIETVKRNTVVIITGQTGCGKSTQVPQYLFDSGFSKNGIILCLHPRCVAAMSLADRVAYEQQCNVGELVGYRVRFHNKYSENTKIMFMTIGYFLRILSDDLEIHKYSAIIVDEAHERSLDFDLVIGKLKGFMQHNKLLRLVIMSATLDSKSMKEFFGTCSEIAVGKTKHFVEEIYQPPNGNNYLEQIKRVVEDIVRNNKKGHVLIFLQSEAKIYKCKKMLKGQRNCIMLPFHSSMDNDDKMRVFSHFGKRRKVIIATNVAETSLTIEGVNFVIDSGLVRRVEYDYKNNVERSVTRPISEAEAIQRKGRTGRTQNGFCYRIYADFSNDSMDDKSTSENKADLKGSTHSNGKISSTPKTESIPSIVLSNKLGKAKMVESCGVAKTRAYADYDDDDEEYDISDEFQDDYDDGEYDDYDDGEYNDNDDGEYDDYDDGEYDDYDDGKYDDLDESSLEDSSCQRTNEPKSNSRNKTTQNAKPIYASKANPALNGASSTAVSLGPNEDLIALAKQIEDALNGLGRCNTTGSAIDKSKKGSKKKDSASKSDEKPKRSKFPEPDILSANLSSMVLILKRLGELNIKQFPFITPPADTVVEAAERYLKDLSLLLDDGQLTKLGKTVSDLPLVPALGKVATIGSRLICRSEVLKIVAMLSVQNVFNKRSNSHFDSPDGDLFKMLTAYLHAETNKFNKDWCGNHGINSSNIKYARLVYRQIERLLPLPSPEAILLHFRERNVENHIKKAFLSGYFTNLCKLTDDKKYLNGDGRIAAPHRDSCVTSGSEIIVYQSIQASENKNCVLRNCVVLNKEMLDNLLPQKFKINANLWRKSLKVVSDANNKD